MSPDNSTPLISVVIAVYNGKATLQQCLDSVTQQTYAHIELIVIDGGSTDGTVDLIRANAQQITYWISEPDRGIYNAWNKALVQAKGDWICFLGADDYLRDAQVLARMAERLVLVPPDIRVAYGQIMLLNNNDAELYAVGEQWSAVKNRFKQTMCVPHPAVMHRHSLFVQHGNFDESFRIAGDYELLLRELQTNDAFFIQGIVMTAMRQGGVSSDPTNTLQGLREVRLAQIKNGLHWPGLGWRVAVLRTYTRLFLWRLLGEKQARKMLDIGRHLMGLPAYWTKT
ncbi:MAG: glycosyl transferase family 2 [uncultured bacterium]|nr:MAG: glycosyl transferase family 2 [uncultured bacterium]